MFILKLNIKKKINYFFIIIFVFGIIFYLFFSYIFFNDLNKLTFGGSSSIFPLITNIQEEIKKNSEKYEYSGKFRYISSGSSAGIWGIVKNYYDIGFVSKNISFKELDENLFADIKIKSDFLEKKIFAKDKIVFLINLPDSCSFIDGKNEINLNKKDIQEIYKNERTWDSLNELNCKKKFLKIKPINRQEGSGTRVVFEQKFMFENGKYVEYKDIKVLKSETKIFKNIISNKNSFGYVSNSKILNLEKSLIIPKIEYKNHNDEKYDFYRPFIIIYLKSKKDKFQNFLNFLKSSEIKKLIIKSGFFINEEI